MHTTLSHHPNDSIRKEEVCQLIELLEFVHDKWDRFERSPARTMNDLTIPKGITRFVINGVAYTLGKRRVLWFRSDDGVYNPNRFYISEAICPNGRPHQLYLDRSRGASYDDLEFLDAKRLGAARMSFISSKGPQVRE